MKKIIKKMTKIKIILGIVLFFLVTTQEAKAAVNFNSSSCGNFYNQEKFEIILKPDVTAINSGGTVAITAEIINNSVIPITDGSLFVRVSSEKGIVDQYFLDQQIYIDSESSKKLNFSWTAPNNISKGNYNFSVYLISANKYEVSGSTFKNGNSLASFDFNLLTSQGEGVALLKDKLEINGEPYNYEPPNGFVVNEDGVVRITLPIQNFTNQVQNVKVTWKNSFWSGISEDDRIKTQQEKLTSIVSSDGFQETVTLNPNEEKVLLYKIEENSFPINYLTATANYKDSKSIVNMRLVKKGNEKARLLMHGLDSFPLRKDESLKVFVCAEKIGGDSSELTSDQILNILREENENFDSELEALSEEEKNIRIREMVSEYRDNNNQSNNYSLILQLKNKRNTLEEFAFHGDLKSLEKQGFEAEYVPLADFDAVTLDAKLINSNGDVVDQSILYYDCNRIDSDKCVMSNMEIIAEEEKSGFWKTFATVLFLILVLALIISIAIYYKKNKMNNKEKGKRTMKMNIFLFLFSLLFIFAIKGKMVSAADYCVEGLEGENETEVFNGDYNNGCSGGGVYVTGSLEVQDGGWVWKCAETAVSPAIFEYCSASKIIPGNCEAYVESGDRPTCGTINGGSIQSNSWPQDDSLQGACSDGSKIVYHRKSGDTHYWKCEDEITGLVSANPECFVTEANTAPGCGSIANMDGGYLWPDSGYPENACPPGIKVVDYREGDNHHYWKCLDEVSGLKSEEECSVNKPELESCRAYFEEDTKCNSNCHMGQFATIEEFQTARNTYGLCIDGAELTLEDPFLVNDRWSWFCDESPCYATLNELGPSDCGPAVQRLDQMVQDGNMTDDQILQELRSSTDLCTDGRMYPDVVFDIDATDEVTFWRWNCN